MRAHGGVLGPDQLAAMQGPLVPALGSSSPTWQDLAVVMQALQHAFVHARVDEQGKLGIVSSIVDGMQMACPTASMSNWPFAIMGSSFASEWTCLCTSAAIAAEQP